MKKSTIITFLICVLILSVAAAVVYMIFSTEPTAQSESATKQMAMLVSVDTAKAGDFTPEFIATGTVQPEEEVQLNALVSGQIVEKSPQYIPGGVVRKGEVLLKIDPSDYENQLALRNSEVLQAQSDLEVELGRQFIAEQDLALIGGDSLSDNQRSLVLREPQLDAVKARIKYAQAAYDQAMLDLKRTSITAPFDAQVITQNVTQGSRVGVADDLGRLVGIDHYWVNISLPVEKLKWLTFPTRGNARGNEVTIRNTTSWAGNESRTGYLFRQVGILDDQTRLASVLVRVSDPLARWRQNRELPRMLIGEFVEARIEGTPIQDVVRLDRDYLRNNQTVWVMENDTLSIRQPDILLIDADYAYISRGLSDGELVVTTNISTVTSGIPLRTESDSSTVTPQPVQ